MAIVIATGDVILMTRYPCTHKEACTIKSKLTEYPWRRLELREV